MQQPHVTALSKPTAPPLDLEQPESFRTATFAMG